MLILELFLPVRLFFLEILSPCPVRLLKTVRLLESTHFISLYRVGSKIKLKCDHPDAQMDGNSKLTCLKGGKWNFDLPFCHQLPCSKTPKYRYIHNQWCTEPSDSAEPHLEIRPNYSVRPILISIFWTESRFGRIKSAICKTEQFGRTITSVPNLYRTFPYLIFNFFAPKKKKL